MSQTLVALLFLSHISIGLCPLEGVTIRYLVEVMRHKLFVPLLADDLVLEYVFLRQEFEDNLHGRGFLDAFHE